MSSEAHSSGTKKNNAEWSHGLLGENPKPKTHLRAALAVATSTRPELVSKNPLSYSFYAHCVGQMSTLKTYQDAQ